MQYTTKETFPMMYPNMSRVYITPEQHEVVFGRDYFSMFFIGSHYEYYFLYDTPEKKNIVLMYVLRFDTPSVKIHKTIDMLLNFRSYTWADYKKCWQQRKYATYETQIVKNEVGHTVDGVESVYIIKAVEDLITLRDKNAFH